MSGWEWRGSGKGVLGRERDEDGWLVGWGVEGQEHDGREMGGMVCVVGGSV